MHNRKVTFDCRPIRYHIKRRKDNDSDDAVCVVKFYSGRVGRRNEKLRRECLKINYLPMLVDADTLVCLFRTHFLSRTIKITISHLIPSVSRH
jgi:hypothetical protein